MKYIWKLSIISFLIYGFYSCNSGEDIPKVNVINIEGIKFSQDDVEVKCNNSLDLEIEITPYNATNQKVRWESSDSLIASVSETGVITGKKCGNCIIKVISVADNLMCATCHVKVLPEHDYVDLGLPSGTLWATESIEAVPWAEIDVNYINPNSTNGYRWGGEKYYIMTKYNGDDGKKQIEPEDDIATSLWGDDWCIPTSEQYKELLECCEHEYVYKKKDEADYEATCYGIKFTRNNQELIIFTNGKSMVGWPTYPKTSRKGEYWTSTLSQDEYTLGFYFYFSEDEEIPQLYVGNRYERKMIWPVKIKKS